MKTRFLVWGILLLAVSLQLGTARAFSPQEWDCPAKNPLLAKLADKGVVLRPVVYATNKICDPEWQRFGSCCDVETTQDFIQGRQDANKLALSDMVSEIDSLDKNLALFLQKSMVGINLPPDYDASDPHASLEKVDSFFEQKSLPHLKAATLELIKLLASWKSTMVTDNTACMKELNKILYSGTCSICSGRSEQFFEGGRIKMAEHTCRGILSECGSTWHRMVMVIEIIEKFTTIIDLVSPATEAHKKQRSFTKSLSAFSNLHSLQKYFGDCKRYEDCDFREISALCETFVTVVGDSLVEKGAVEAIPKLTGSPIVPHSEVAKLDNLLHFVVTATSKLIAQVDKEKENKASNPFFKEVMSFKTLMQYLGKLKRSIFDTRFAVLKAYKQNKLGFEASLRKTLEKCDKLLSRINEYLVLVEKKKEEIQTYLESHNERLRVDSQKKDQDYRNAASNPPAILVSSLAKVISTKKKSTTLSSSTNSTTGSGLFAFLSQIKSASNSTTSPKPNSPVQNLFSNIGWAIGNWHKALSKNTTDQSTGSSSGSGSIFGDIAKKIKDSLAKVVATESKATVTNPGTVATNPPVLTWHQKLSQLKSAVSAKYSTIKSVLKPSPPEKSSDSSKIASTSSPKLPPSSSQSPNPVPSNHGKSQPKSISTAHPQPPATIGKPLSWLTQLNPATLVNKLVATTTAAAVHHKPAVAAPVPAAAPVHHKPAPAPAAVHHKPAAAPAPVYHRPAPAPAPAPVYHRPAPAPTPAPAPVYHRPAPVHSAPASRPSWSRKLFMLATTPQSVTSASEVQVVRDGDPTTVAPFDLNSP